MNPPKYSISSLKRSMLTPKQLLEQNHAEQHHTNIHEHEPLHKTVVTQNISTSSPQPSIGNTFYGQLQHEILLLEEALESESLNGLSISRIDQYARQVTHPFSVSSCTLL